MSTVVHLNHLRPTEELVRLRSRLWQSESSNIDWSSVSKCTPVVSYGGFTVAHLLGHPENNLTRCGVAVAPVTDFKYYDTVYTERHLGRINDNPDAYLQTQVARNARNFRSKSVLLMHGTADGEFFLITVDAPFPADNFMENDGVE
ncbi:hypothetical protein X801_07651 [Opisthorchis viverrini]|uniref:Peptidase S9 prolyl oligopeptidase catalytic domain-containing protein n=1 Tax=Opisthorchis viverrini TaxID=6198 RepID=A0A1S8WQ04_OPIVI|nr:hypothetical protein X801_07651 [Opisthorchis viverrini]